MVVVSLNNYIIEQEKELLAHIIFDYEKVQNYVSRLSVTDFTLVKHQELFKHIKDYLKKNDTIDKNFTKSVFNNHIDYIYELAQIKKYLLDNNFKQVFDLVKYTARETRLRDELQKVICDSPDIINDLQKIIDNNPVETTEDYQSVLSNHFIDFMQNICKPYDNKNIIKTGFSLLDYHLNGLRQSSISILAARPSTGKTTLALNILKNQVRHSRKSIMFSLEMTKEQIDERLLADLTAINYTKISQHQLSNDEQIKVCDFATKFMSQQCFYLFDDIYTIENITRVISEIKPVFVVIDYIQIIKTLERFNNRRDEIDYIMRELKKCAKNYNCHIMILSQIARDGKDKPTMSDLKESGSIEENGDYIMLLHRPYVLDKLNPELSPKKSQVLLDKNKYGQCGTFNFNFNGEFQRFTEVEKRY